MPKHYAQAMPAVLDLITERIKGFYADLAKASVRFSVLMVTKDGPGPALMVRGHAALACISANSQTIRAAGGADALLQIDAAKWEKMDEDQQAALIDHELHHLELTADEDEATGFKLDPEGRPVLKMKKHDFEFGWFVAIAERHGMKSPEVTQAKLVWDDAGNFLFPFLAEKLELQ